MIINNSKKYIFVHISKNAGTSITIALERLCKWNDIVLGSTSFGEGIEPFYRQKFNLHKHSTSKEIIDQIGAHEWKSFFSFAFVRHPYERAVSTYTFFRKMLAEDRALHPLLKWLNRFRKKSIFSWEIITAILETKSFSEFIRHPGFVSAPAARPQYRWIYDDNGKKLVDFIGRMERIDQDFDHLIRKIGYKNINLERKNVSNTTKKYSQYCYKEDDLVYLYKLYQKDFDLFQYDRNKKY